MKYVRHKNFIKIYVALFVVMVFLIEPTNTYAVSQSEVTSKLNSLMNQYVGTTWNDEDMGRQCKGFANMIFRNLFGVYIGPYPNSENYRLENANAVEVGVLSPSSMTQNTAVELLKKGAPGDYIQVRRRASGGPHSMIFVSKDSGGITVFDCNSDGRNGVRSYYITWNSFYSKNCAVSLYHAKNYEVQTSHNPAGAIDSVTGGTGSVAVSGWAFDEDALSEALDIHVYIGGPAGSGAPCYIIKANKERADVSNVYPEAGKYHGYCETLETDRTGTQDIYIYAINKGGGYNTLLGYKTVTIKKLNHPTGVYESASGGPSSVNVKGWAYDADDVSRALDIHVYIGGECSSPNAEGHIISANQKRTDVGNAYSGIGNYHGFSADIATEKTGKQKVYVYAINIGGGSNQLLGCKEVTIQKKPRSVESVSIVNEKGDRWWNTWIDSVGKSIVLRAEVYPEDADNKKVTWSSSDSSIVSVDSNGKVTAKKVGNAYITATTKDGGYSSKCLIRVVSGNVIYGDADKNGTISATDLSHMNGVVNGTITASEADKVTLDLNGDSKVTQEDLDLLNQFVLGLIDRFPVESMLAEINITRKPDTLSYYVGDAFKTTGMQVTAVYRNGSSKVVTGYNVSADLSTAGEQKATVTYSEAGVTRTATFTVQVSPVSLNKILIFRKPDKTSYIKGEEINTAGMIVKAQYTNGTTKTVTDYIVESARNFSEGEQQVKITYEENGVVCTAYCNITVIGTCEAYGHTWNYQNTGNRVHARICSICGAKEEESCKLSVVTIEATCINDGYTEHFCTLCDYSYVDNRQSKLEHTYDCVITKEASCISNGIKTYTCSYCGDSYEKEIFADGHTWNTGVVTKEATTSEDGIKTYTCTKCNAVKTEVIPAMGEKDNQEPTVPTNPSESGEGNIGESTEAGNVGEDTEKDGSENDNAGNTESDASETGSDAEDGVEDEPEELPAVGDILMDIDGKAEYEIISIEKSGICVEYTETVNRKDSTVTIPDKVELEDGMICKVVSVADSAFKNNKYIKKIIVGNNVKIIGNKAFYGCKNLTSISLGKNVTTIETNAFTGCVKVKSLTLPSKVKKIGSNAFYGCKKLKTLTIKSTKLTSKSVAKKAFKNLPAKVIIKVPKSKVSTYKKLLHQKGLNAKIKITKL